MPLGPFAAAAAVPAAGAVLFGLVPLFLFFLKVGSVLFGSGYVLLAFLRADLVERWGWLSEGQLLDAVAVGQVTPGPVFTTATFIGYLLGRAPGAILATVGIFLARLRVRRALRAAGPAHPPLAARRCVPRRRQRCLDRAHGASSRSRLGRAALVDIPTVALALASALLLIRFRVNSSWLVLGGALLGLALRG